MLNDGTGIFRKLDFCPLSIPFLQHFTRFFFVLTFNFKDIVLIMNGIGFTLLDSQHILSAQIEMRLSADILPFGSRRAE